MTATIILASCGSDEHDDLVGDWDDMIWKTEVKATEQDGTYLVAATGGELTFSCKNYQHRGYQKPYMPENTIIPTFKMMNTTQ